MSFTCINNFIIKSKWKEPSLKLINPNIFAAVRAKFESGLNINTRVRPELIYTNQPSTLRTPYTTKT